MSKRPHRNWVAFGAVLGLVTVSGLNALRQGTKNDSSNGKRRRNSYSTIVTNMQELTEQGKKLVETAKLSGLAFKDVVQEEVKTYQADIQPSLAKIQQLADEAKKESEELSPSPPSN